MGGEGCIKAGTLERSRLRCEAFEDDLLRAFGESIIAAGIKSLLKDVSVSNSGRRLSVKVPLPPPLNDQLSSCRTQYVKGAICTKRAGRFSQIPPRSLEKVCRLAGRASDL